jgi:small subunit ribosomal protein S2
MQNSSFLTSSMSQQHVFRRKLLIYELRYLILNQVINFNFHNTKIETYKKMLKKSMHYGHKIIQCHPSMKKFVRGQYDGKHLIDLIQTRQYLIKALWFLTKYAYQKKSILFVGTTVPSARFVATVALKTKSFFVNVRWLGGMLSNWRTIKKLIKKLKQFQQQTKIYATLTKKELGLRKKESQRLEKYLKGMKMIRRFPQVVILASQINHMNAALECQKIGICNFSIVDTNCNANLADFIVPANDDSASSIKFVLYYFARAIYAGQVLAKMKIRLKKILKANKSNVFLNEKKINN